MKVLEKANRCRNSELVPIPAMTASPWPPSRAGCNSANVTAWILALRVDFQLLADLADQIHMEAGKLAGLIDKIERREIHGGQKPQPGEAAQVRFCDALARVEQQRQIVHPLRSTQWRWQRCNQIHAKREYTIGF